MTVLATCNELFKLLQNRTELQVTHDITYMSEQVVQNPNCASDMLLFLPAGPAVADRLMQDKKTQVSALELKYMDLLKEKHAHVSHAVIFTRADNSLRWTCFGPTRFIHPWMTLVHATLRVSDVIDKCNSWLADITFDWRHVIVTAVERNNQTCRAITFLRCLFPRFKSKFHK